MKRMFVVAALVMAAAAGAQVTSAPQLFSFRGEHLGDSMPRRAEDVGCTDRSAADTVRSCVRLDSIGAAMVGIVREYYHNRLLRFSVSFSSAEVGIIEKAATEKYGPPSSRKTEDFQTLAGGHLSGIVTSWVLAPDTLIVRQFGTETSYGMLGITDPALFHEWQKYNQKKNGM